MARGKEKLCHITAYKCYKYDEIHVSIPHFEIPLATCDEYFKRIGLTQWKVASLITLCLTKIWLHKFVILLTVQLKQSLATEKTKTVCGHLFTFERIKMKVLEFISMNPFSCFQIQCVALILIFH